MLPPVTLSETAICAIKEFYRAGCRGVGAPFTCAGRQRVHQLYLDIKSGFQYCELNRNQQAGLPWRDVAMVPHPFRSGKLQHGSNLLVILHFVGGSTDAIFPRLDGCL
jgi:hypothetical protein